MEAKQFGQFIAGIRKEKKMTQAELAEKIHVTDKAISRWERGLGFPDIQTLEPLAQVLGISVLELMRSEKKKPTGDMDTTETQYTQKEVAEMLQNADDISKQLNSGDWCGCISMGNKNCQSWRRSCARRTLSSCVCFSVVFFSEY